MSRKLVKPAEEKAQARESIRLSGRNIYTDKQGRTIYYDWVTKQGYLIEKKSEKAALFYKNRFAVILMAAILFGATFLTVIQAVIAGAVMLVLAELTFRLSFLKKLEPVRDVDFEKRVSGLQYIVTEKSKGTGADAGSALSSAGGAGDAERVRSEIRHGADDIQRLHRGHRSVFQRASFCGAGKDQPE